MFTAKGLEDLNANVRWTFARFRLDGIDTIVYRVPFAVPRKGSKARRTRFNQIPIRVSGFLFVSEGTRTIRCKCPVDIRSIPARRNRHLTICHRQIGTESLSPCSDQYSTCHPERSVVRSKDLRTCTGFQGNCSAKILRRRACALRSG